MCKRARIPMGPCASATSTAHGLMHGRHGAIRIVHPGILVHFDMLCLNRDCGQVFSQNDFKLCESEENRYGFTFIGFVSMETLLTFEPEIFMKTSKYLTTPTVKLFSYFFLEPTQG